MTTWSSLLSQFVKKKKPFLMLWTADARDISSDYSSASLWGRIKDSNEL